MATLPPPIPIIAFGNVAESGLYRLLRFQKRRFFINYPRNNASNSTIQSPNTSIIAIQIRAFYRHIYRLKNLFVAITKNKIKLWTMLSEGYEKITFYTVLKPY